MNKTNREIIYNKYNGHCGYCGKEIDYKDMQIDHIKPKAIGGRDENDNYMPACRRCNHYKRTLGLEGFRQYITMLDERIVKNYITKVGIDFGIIELNKFNGVFYFEEKDAKIYEGNKF